jgi:hypothetical protein
MINAEDLLDALHELLLAADEREGLAPKRLVRREPADEGIGGEPGEQPKVVLDREGRPSGARDVTFAIRKAKEVHLPAFPLDAPVGGQRSPQCAELLSVGDVACEELHVLEGEVDPQDVGGEGGPAHCVLASWWTSGSVMAACLAAGGGRTKR